MGGDKLTLSLTVLLTGFAVVFAVLLILIGIIKLYGTIIYNLQNKGRSKTKKSAPAVRSAPASDKVMEPVAEIEADEVDDGELIAVIAAAVYAMYPTSQVRIKSVRKSKASSNAWRSAGLSEYLRPF